MYLYFFNFKKILMKNIKIFLSEILNIDAIFLEIFKFLIYIIFYSGLGMIVLPLKIIITEGLTIRSNNFKERMYDFLGVILVFLILAVFSMII